MNKNTFGAIDLGSNSLQMVLGRKEGETLTIFRRELREPRLGEGLQPGGKLNHPAKKRTRQALLSLLEIMGGEQIETGIIAATSAIREAADGKQFLDEIAAISPFPVRLLSGEEEAYYGFRGAVTSSAVPVDEEEAIVLDVGGRSTELSWREQGKVCGCSMLTGAVKMHELFRSSLDKGDDTPLKDYVKNVLTEQIKAFPGTRKKLLIGVGGTITTITALSQNLQHYDPQKIHGYTLTRTEIQKHQQLLLTSTLEKRRQLLPFAPARADIIPAGATILLSTMEYLTYDHLTTSEGGILTGLLAEIFGCKTIRLLSRYPAEASQYTVLITQKLTEQGAISVNNISSNYIAHYCKEDGREQSLIDHLEGTAKLARQFANHFNANELSYACGLLHDYGKYSSRFQRRIRGENIKADHSTPGGQFVYNQNIETSAGNLRKIAAYCIMGHHGKGLPDSGSDSDSDGAPTLRGRLQKQSPDCSAFLTECSPPALVPPKIPIIDGFGVAFFIRMLFSALVDADYLNTEEFFQKGNNPRGGLAKIDELEEKLSKHIHSFLSSKNADKPLNVHRNALLNNCLDAAKEKSGLFTLTAPTGSGKTIASLAFALRHAVGEGSIRRIIYIVPYNTIIEQNAAVFEDILGSENVLQHHSNVQYGIGDEENDNKPYSEEESRKRYSTENWDYPLIVTSNVQFFESLFAARPGKCRKLHNLSNSVLIFDEAQMIPLPYLKPCIKAIQELVQNYGCTAVLTTATQTAIESYWGPLNPKEISKNTKEMYSIFKRTTIKNILNEPFSEETLACRLSEHERVLCIVNTKKRAQQLFTKLKESKNEGTYHLSTTMYPIHRSRILNEIRKRLSDPANLPCRVVSTSLVEAGVDLDFPAVYREEAGLDSIVQAAGRCNREGKQLPDESIVYIFSFEERSIPASQRANVDTFLQIARIYDNLDAPETIHAYFEQLFYNKGDAALDEKSVINKFNQGIKSLDFPFRTIAEEFRLIDQKTQDIYALMERPDLEKRLRSGERSRSLFREIGLYAVSLYHNEMTALDSLGQIDKLDEEIRLMPRLFYNNDLGVNLQPKGGDAIFPD